MAIASLSGNLLQHVDIYAKPNRYRLDIGVPRVLAGNMTAYKSLNQIGRNCSAITMPGTSVATIDHRMGNGSITKLPYDKIFNPVTATFFNDEKHKDREIFVDWNNSINNGFSSTFEYYENYVTYITIVQLDQKHVPTAAYRLHEAYPSAVSDLQLGYDMENALETFTVTFMYRRFEKLDIVGI